MSGINIVHRVQRIVKTAEEMGFALCYPRHGGNGEEHIGLRPIDDKFPLYGMKYGRARWNRPMHFLQVFGLRVNMTVCSR